MTEPAEEVTFYDGPMSALAVSVVAANCAAPAPLVVNGAAYAGCQLDVGHEGPHSVEIRWSSGR